MACPVERNSARVAYNYAEYMLREKNDVGRGRLPRGQGHTHSVPLFAQIRGAASRLGPFGPQTLPRALPHTGPGRRPSLIEMTIPDKPNSRLQKYHLTDKGRQWLAQHGAWQNGPLSAASRDVSPYLIFTI